jgi:hypothetical protein
MTTPIVPRTVLLRVALRDHRDACISTTGTTCHDVIRYDGTLATTFNDTSMVVTSKT